MALPLDAEEDVFDVIEASHEAASEIEAGRAMHFSRRPRLSRRQARPEYIVDDTAKRSLLSLDRRLQARRDVIVQRKCRPHDALMLSC
jgi:hypothetical protein